LAPRAAEPGDGDQGGSAGAQRQGHLGKQENWRREQRADERHARGVDERVNGRPSPGEHRVHRVGDRACEHGHLARQGLAGIELRRVSGPQQDDDACNGEEDATQFAAGQRLGRDGEVREQRGR
jgi:hypothetical protein